MVNFGIMLFEWEGPDIDLVRLFSVDFLRTSSFYWAKC